MKKIERDQFFARVGHTSDDIQIWGQYERLVDFILIEYPKSNRRFDEISLPTLFTISHALELALKENIKFFKQYHESLHTKNFDNWTALIKSHNLEKLSDEFKIGYNKLHEKVGASKEDKEKFSAYYLQLEKLIQILNRNTETFRYALKIDKSGNAVNPSIAHDKTINFLEIKELFEEMKELFVGAPNSFGIYTDFIDFKKGNPKYTKGKGYLYRQRLPYSEHYLERVKNILSEQLTSLDGKAWLDKKTAERFEIEIWEGDIYIIAI